MADLIGQQLGVYRIIKKLGEGGFAKVYLAEHIHVENMFVAIKILKDTLPEKANKQFFKEAGTISLLRHPHIIRLLHCDLYNGQPYLVMDYIKEGSLRNRYPEGTILPLSTIVHYVKQIADALQHAHVSGIVHRDIKPDNILWENDDALLVSDFGIATGSYTKGYGEQEKIGTLPYMAPEQFRAKAQSASDQYSLAIVVYEWLCGTPPFADGDFFQMGYQHISVQPPPLHEKITISLAIEEVVMKALAKEPRDRYENIAAFSMALENAYNASLPGVANEQVIVLPLPPSIPPSEYAAMHVAPPTPVSIQEDGQPLNNESQVVVNEQHESSRNSRPLVEAKAADFVADTNVRQGNGSDLLGANDPRSATIGIIYVNPNNDWDSVLTAIFTQEKLGRKQIAIVLPAQNKAFQRPIDFEKLKNMQRKLQAQLIIVAPQGSSPADYARQRRFTCFSSLESYGRSLREEGDHAPRPVKRGLFAVRRTSRPKPVANANDDAMVVPPQNVPDEEQPPNNIISLAGAGAAGQVMDHIEVINVQEQFQPNQKLSDDGGDELVSPSLPHVLNLANVDNDNEEQHPIVPTPIVAPVRDDELQDQVAVGSVPWYRSIGENRRKFGVLILASVLLLLVLVLGGIALAAPGTFSSTLGSIQKFNSNAVGGGTPIGTVTIEPKNALLSNTYVVTGITSGTPDSSKRQVEARQLTFTTQPQSKTVSATGAVRTQGTRATGTITFYNSSTSAYYVTAGTVFTDAQGIQIANDGLVAIPAANPNSGFFGKVTVSAHAVNVGSSGNIPAGDITNLQCCGNAAVGVSTNGAFSGGQDPQNYTAVQQSDVDNAVNPLKAPLLQSALTSLNGQKHVNEQYVQTPPCTTKVTSNPAVGAKATSVTVSVTATCSGRVYDQVGAQTIAANLLKGEADKDTGGNYALTGNLVTTITSVTADSKGNLSILVKAEGVWVYQFDATAKTNLAKLIAGKAQNDATSLLLQQAGVSKVDSITISNGGNTLPTDYKQITIVVQSVKGIQGTPTGSSGATPTTRSTAEPVTVTPTTAGS